MGTERSRSDEGRRGRYLAALLASLLVAASCGGDSSTSDGAGSEGDRSATVVDEAATPGDERRGGTLDVAISADASSLDPQRGAAGTDHIILYPMFDTLIDFDPATLEPRPGLAREWEHVTPTQLRLHLQEDVLFHDGTPMDGAAVKASLDRYRALGAHLDLESVTEVSVVDDLTVDIHLSRPDSSLVLVLADRAGMVVSPSAVAERGEAFDVDPVGTGPFEFVEWREGDHITMRRFGDYWQEGRPDLDEIVMHVLTDRFAAQNGLLSGQIDFADQLDPGSLEQLAAVEGLTVSADETVLVRMIYLNSSFEPLDDVRVRRAINHAIDRQGIVDAVQFGLGEVAWLPVPQSHWAYDPEPVPAWEYDPDLARRLLAEAGVPDGFDLDVVLPADDSFVRVAEAIQAQLAAVGINYILHPMDWTQGIEMYYRQQAFPAAQHSWTGRPDPGQTYQRLFHTESFENPAGLEIPGLVDILQNAVTTSDQAERAAWYADGNPLIVEQAPWVPLYFNANVTARRSEITNYEPTLLGKPKVAFLRLG